MFYRFLVFSGCAALVNFLTGFVLYGLAGWDQGLEYVAAVGFAFLAGMGVSFTLNRAFTFEKSGRQTGEELRDFTFVSIVGLALTTGIAHFTLLALKSVGFAGWALVTPESSAHVFAIGMTAFYSFFAHKHFSFRKTRGGGLDETKGEHVWIRK